MSTVETDTSPSAILAETEFTKASISALAIIGITDHQTRVATGGSALPRSAPIVGLLFGYQEGNIVSIVDTEEMEWPNNFLEASSSKFDPCAEHRAAVFKKIELHQKVFPHHAVVGWYRVQKEEHPNDSRACRDSQQMVPTEEDLQMNKMEISKYCGESIHRPLFMLMNANSPQYTGNSRDESKASVTKSAPAEEVLRDNLLPFSVYEALDIDGGASVFVNIDIQLQTYEPERIALERILKSTPATTITSFNLEDTALASKEETAADSKKGNTNKKDDTQDSNHSETRPPSALDAKLDSLQSSIRSMNARIKFLLDFLRKVENRELPANDTLLRIVDGLIQQLPLVLAALEEGSATHSANNDPRIPLEEVMNEYNNTSMLAYLATVAKTANAVHVYSKKFRSAFDNSQLRDIGGHRTAY